MKYVTWNVDARFTSQKSVLSNTMFYEETEAVRYKTELKRREEVVFS